MNDYLFRGLTAILFVTGAAISIYHRRKADREGGERISLKDEGLFITLALRFLGLALWGCVFAYLINPAWIAWARYDLPEWLRWVGIGLGVIADGMIYWVFTHLGNNVTPTVVTRARATLVTTGPYRWVRHPLYLTGSLSYLGILLVAENWLMAVLAILGAVFLAIRTGKEEERLIDRFGDEYRRYMLRTGRFFPRLFQG